MISETDKIAADYIVSLWGAHRRDWAYRYWMNLSHSTPRPDVGECFGSDRIERYLNKIYGHPGL